MKKNHNIFLVLTLLAIISVTGCYSHFVPTKGNGNVVEQVRNVADFDNVLLKGSANIYVSQGDKCEVKIVSDENLMEKIETEVDGKNLEISTKSMSPTKLDVYVTMKNVRGFKIMGSGDVTNKTPLNAENLYLNISGSGNFKIDGVTAKGVKVELYGSGDISVKGKSYLTKVDIFGSGNVNLEDLEVEDAAVKIAGSGDCNVNAKAALNADIYGSGNIHYKGDPKEFKSHKYGSGEIKQIK